MEGKPINKKYLGVFILINLAFMIFLNLIYHYFENFNEIEKSNMLYINTHAQKIYIEDSPEFIYKLKELNTQESFIIWQKLSEDLVGLLYWGNFDFPPITEGRFFSPSDFYSNNHLAVIGKNMISHQIEEEQSSFIELFGNRYEVIGILGNTYPTNLDNTVYFNLDSSVFNNIFYIDGKDSTTIALAINHLSKIAPVKNIDDSPHGIGRLFGYSDKNYKFKIVCIIISMIAIFLSINFFANTYFNQIMIQHLLGISAPLIISRLILILFIWLIILLIIGTFISNVLLPYLLVWQAYKNPIHWILLGIAYIFSQLLGSLLYFNVKLRGTF